jgi:hypothetical protein
MKIEIEVPDEIVAKFGLTALKTFLEFKVQNLADQAVLKNESADLPETDEEKVREAWAKVKKMGPSC